MRQILRGAILFLFLFTNFIYASKSEIFLEKEIDWQKQEIYFLLRVAVEQEGLPSSRQRAEGWIERERFRVIAKGLGDIVLDSLGTFDDNQSLRNNIRWNLNTAVTMAKRERASLTTDLKYLEVLYKLSFNDIMLSVFVDTVQRVRPLLTSRISEFDYTGIVIFVASELPVHRRFNQKQALEMALAPMILDEDGETLLSLSTINPEVFRQGLGGVEYTFLSDIHRWSPIKIGLNPYIISAVAVSGDVYKTNLVISNRDANRLRSSAKAIEMLHNAKVLIVVNSNNS